MVYTEILPCLQMLDRQISFPRTFFGDYKDKGLLIMEDLKESGYFLGDKMKGRCTSTTLEFLNDTICVLVNYTFTGISMNEIKLVLDQLARIHSCSYHFMETYKGGSRKFQETYPIFFHESFVRKASSEGVERFVKLFFEVSFSSFALAMSWIFTGEDEHLGKRLLELEKNREEVFDTAYRADYINGFNVLTHGDCWVNNFMLK